MARRGGEAGWRCGVAWSGGVAGGGGVAGYSKSTHICEKPEYWEVLNYVFVHLFIRLSILLTIYEFACLFVNLKSENKKLPEDPT